MHPILFRIPLPGWTLPLFPTLLVAAGIGLVLAALGWRKKIGDLLLVGGVLAVGCGFAAFGMRGKTYTLSELPIYSYGAMLCLSLVVGWFLTLGLAERDGLSRDTMANCYFITAVGALIGARLLYVLTNSGEFQQAGDLLNIRRGGMVAYGGFLGGFAASWFFLRTKQLRLLPWADVAVPSLASGLLITRIGCYLFGCDFGKPLSDTAPAWLARLGTFPRWPDGTLPEGSGSPAWVQHVNQQGLLPDSTASLPVHPTQLYESLAGLFLLGLVFWLRKRQTFRGQVFFAFTFAYGLLRFLIEILRDDLERGEFGPHLSQHVFLLLALLAFAAAFCYGPARSITNPRVRVAAQAVSVVPAVVVFFWLKPPSFAAPTPLQLSTSQWIAMLTAIGVAAAWSTYARSAELHPQAAMSLGIEAALPEDDDGAPEEPSAKADEPASKAAPASDSATRKKKRRKRRATRGETPEAKRKEESEVPEAEAPPPDTGTAEKAPASDAETAENPLPKADETAENPPASDQKPSAE
jgi:phosphatidylglycerol---prolipoprotein diacylglyceryl transferase